MHSAHEVFDTGSLNAGGQARVYFLRQLWRDLLVEERGHLLGLYCDDWLPGDSS